MALTGQEIDWIEYAWLNKPCTFQELVDDINQFRDEPVSDEEIQGIIDKLY